MKKLFFFCS
jgi:hypothetical protein